MFVCYAIWLYVDIDYFGFEQFCRERFKGGEYGELLQIHILFNKYTPSVISWQGLNSPSRDEDWTYRNCDAAHWNGTELCVIDPATIHKTNLSNCVFFVTGLFFFLLPKQRWL